jgi:N4-gp56 family major capsid protein
MADTLGTNTTGYSYPGSTYNRKGVFTVQDMALWQAMRDELVLSAFIGKEGSRAPFITKSELKTKRGDTITCEMSGKITGLGKWGNSTLEGYEAPITQYYVDGYVNQIRQAGKDDGEMSRQRSIRDTMKLVTTQLGAWWAENFERYLFCAMYGKYPPHILGSTTIKGYNINNGVLTPNKNWFCADGANNNPALTGTVAASAADIALIQSAEAQLTNDEADYFSPNVLEGVRSFVARTPIELAKFNGQEGIVGFIDPNQVTQLRKNSDWFQANIHGMPPGTTNPVFTGKVAGKFVGIWGNIWLIESNLVQGGDESYFSDLMDAEYTAMGGQSTENTVEIDSSAPNVRRALFCGANSAAVVEGVAPHLERKEDFDYNDKRGCAISGVTGMVRADFVADASGSAVVNQSSCVVSTYSPNANT